MSGYYYPPHTSPPLEDEQFDFAQPYQPQRGQPQNAFPPYTGQPAQPATPFYAPGQFYNELQPAYEQPQQFPQQFSYQHNQPQAWATPTVPSNYSFQQENTAPFPAYTELPNFSSPEMPLSGPSRVPTGYLSPDEAVRSRISRSTSFASNASSISESDFSRSTSPNASEMAKWGRRNDDGTWKCAYPGCTSRSAFNRGCDLRKHYKRHTKSLFCRHEGCPQATEGGFSSKKDRARHEAKHDPRVLCEWEGCDRLFSRADNMKDHVRRVHGKKLSE